MSVYIHNESSHHERKEGRLWSKEQLSKKMKGLLCDKDKTEKRQVSQRITGITNCLRGEESAAPKDTHTQTDKQMASHKCKCNEEKEEDDSPFHISIQNTALYYKQKNYFIIKD